MSESYRRGSCKEHTHSIILKRNKSNGKKSPFSIERGWAQAHVLMAGITGS